MHSLKVSVIVFLWVFGGAIIGMLLRKFLPEDHLTSDAKDVVRLATGLVVTMSALVLGMLVSSAKSSYDLQKTRSLPWLRRSFFWIASSPPTGPKLLKAASNSVNSSRRALSAYGPLKANGITNFSRGKTWMACSTIYNPSRQRTISRQPLVLRLLPCHRTAREPMGSVSPVGEQLYLHPTAHRRRVLAGRDLHQLRPLCAAKWHRHRHIDRLRHRGFGRHLHHPGNVFAVQRIPEDLLRSHSRRAKSAGELASARIAADDDRSAGIPSASSRSRSFRRRKHGAHRVEGASRRIDSGSRSAMRGSCSNPTGSVPPLPTTASGTVGTPCGHFIGARNEISFSTPPGKVPANPGSLGLASVVRSPRPSLNASSRWHSASWTDIVPHSALSDAENIAGVLQFPCGQPTALASSFLNPPIPRFSRGTLAQF